MNFVILTRFRLHSNYISLYQQSLYSSIYDNTNGTIVNKVIIFSLGNSLILLILFQEKSQFVQK